MKLEIFVSRLDWIDHITMNEDPFLNPFAFPQMRNPKHKNPIKEQRDEFLEEHRTTIGDNYEPCPVCQYPKEIGRPCLNKKCTFRHSHEN